MDEEEEEEEDDGDDGDEASSCPPGVTSVELSQQVPFTLLLFWNSSFTSNPLFAFTTPEHGWPFSRKVASVPIPSCTGNTHELLDDRSAITH
jgi:hypothetical protein